MNIPIQSVILEGNEFELIHSAIKERLNKEVREIKKLYQATVDGFKSNVFHSKCDNISNTLILIKSEGNRRFGGFTTCQWSSPLYAEPLYDKNTFLFSLDKKAIYSYTNEGCAIKNKGDCGPIFGAECDIYIKNYIFYTNESNFMIQSFDYKGDENALSESGNASKKDIAEYEVFEVKF